MSAARPRRPGPARPTWDGVRAVVAGIGVSGFAAADNLTHLGATVTALDEADADDRSRRRPTLLEILGADGPARRRARPSTLPDDVDLVVTSPGVAADGAAARRGRRARRPGLGRGRARLAAARPRAPAAPGWPSPAPTARRRRCRCSTRSCGPRGLRGIACGNVGLPIVEAVMDPEPYDVFAVELSSFQLHYTSSMSAQSAAVLNVAEDHLDWYAVAGATTPPTRAGSTSSVQHACVYNVADPVTEQLVREADVVEGARAIGFTLGTPGVGMVGLVDDVLADRAFIDERREQRRRAVHGRRPGLARPRTSSRTPSPRPPSPARTACRPPPYATGCGAFVPDGHRIADAGRGRRGPLRRRLQGHQPARRHRPRCRPTTRSSGSPAGSPRARRSTTWWRPCTARLRGVVLLGRDRAVIAEALARHAPDVPVIEVDGGDTSVMDRVVGAAARPGPARRHRAAGAGLRVHGHVRELRRTRGRLRRGGTPACGTAEPEPARGTAPPRQGAAPRDHHGRPTQRRPVDGRLRQPAALAGAHARPAAHVLLPAARRLDAAADHRADDGAQRLERRRPTSTTATATYLSSASSPGCCSRCPCAFVASRLPHRVLRGVRLAGAARRGGRCWR